MMLPHAYYSEVVQTFASIVGFIFSIWAVWDARNDELFWQGVLKEETDLKRVSISTQSRYEISKVHTASELATVIAQVVLLVVGVSGLFLTPPDGYATHDYNELLGISISRYGMVVVTCTLTFKSIIRRRGRVTYIRTMRRRTDSSRTLLNMTPTASSDLTEEE
jgi:hypothetical protein